MESTNRGEIRFKSSHHQLRRSVTISCLPVSIARTTAWATRSGGDRRGSPHGKSPLSSSNLSKCSVSVGPAATTSTSIPSRDNSARKASLKPCRANLLAEYSLLCGQPRSPRIEPMFTMIGWRPLRSAGRATRISSTGEKIDFHDRPQVRGSAVANRPWAEMPALLTRMSSPPNSRTAASTGADESADP